MQLKLKYYSDCDRVFTDLDCLFFRLCLMTLMRIDHTRLRIPNLTNPLLHPLSFCPCFIHGVGSGCWGTIHSKKRQVGRDGSFTRMVIFPENGRITHGNSSKCYCFQPICLTNASGFFSQNLKMRHNSNPTHMI